MNILRRTPLIYTVYGFLNSLKRLLKKIELIEIATSLKYIAAYLIMYPRSFVGAVRINSTTKPTCPDVTLVYSLHLSVRCSFIPLLDVRNPRFTFLTREIDNQSDT